MSRYRYQPPPRPSRRRIDAELAFYRPTKLNPPVSTGGQQHELRAGRELSDSATTPDQHPETHERPTETPTN